MPSQATWLVDWLVVATLGGGDSPASPDSIAAQVDAIVGRALKQGPLAGVAVGVARGDETIVAKGYGFADLESEAPVTEHTVFRLASVTKQFTAVAILQLVEDGKLALDDPLSKLAPEFPTGDHVVTLRQLLNHTSGLPSVTSLPDFAQRTETVHSREALLDLVRGKPLDFAPGEEFAYNNTAFILAGAIVERASGLPYDQAIAERLFAPLGMSDSCYGWETPVIKRRAQGYTVANGKLVNDGAVDMVIPGGAGALASSVADLLKWARALQTNAILGDASWAEMTAPTVLEDGVTVDYGFGIVTDVALGQPRVGHGGNIQGFNTWIEWYPELELSIAVLVNTEGESAREIAARIVKLLVPAPAESKPEVAFPAELMAACAGTFVRAGRPLVLVVDGDHLTAKLGDQPATRLRLVRASPERIELAPEAAPDQRIHLVKVGGAIDHVTVVGGLTAGRFRRP